METLFDSFNDPELFYEPTEVF